MNYSKGISWFDDCRIPFEDKGGINFDALQRQNELGDIYGGGKGFHKKHINKLYKTEGRFPANLLVSDDMLNDGSVSNSSGGKGEKTLGTLGRNGIYNKGWGKDETADGLGGYGDKGSNSRYYDIDKWFDNLLQNYIY